MSDTLHRDQGSKPAYDWGTDPGAQDVIDALRIALLAQGDPVKVHRLVSVLLDFAPETDSGRGMDLLMRLLSEATLQVSVATGGSD